MTIEQKLREMLFNRGMFEPDIDTVMASFKALKYNDVMQGRWNERISDYGEFAETMLAGLSIGLFNETLSWIDENKPKAWFRGNFVIE